MRVTGGNVGIGTTAPNNILAIEKSSNSGSGSGYPLQTIKNTLATQGDGSSTFNFAGLNIGSGNGAVDMYLSTSYASGTWEPAGLLTVVTNHPLIVKTNNTERMRITSTGNVGIGTTSPSEKLEVNGAIKTAAPSGGTAKPWKLGEAGVSVGGANTTAVKVEIDGVVYYLLTAYLPEPAPESAPKPKPEG